MTGTMSNPSGRPATEPVDVRGEQNTQSVSLSPGAVARLVHDLRSPLGTILMTAELVALETGGGRSRELDECLATLERAIRELERGLEALEAHASASKDDAAHG